MPRMPSSKLAFLRVAQPTAGDDFDLHRAGRARVGSVLLSGLGERCEGCVAHKVSFVDISFVCCEGYRKRAPRLSYYRDIGASVKKARRRIRRA